MGTRKLRFTPIKEGNLFSTIFLQSMFDKMEEDLNRTAVPSESDQGLYPDAMAEGSINYQHLDQEGTHTGIDSGTAIPNYGSCLVGAESFFNASRGNLYSDYQAHGGVDVGAFGLTEVPLTTVTGPGWSFGETPDLDNGVVISADQPMGMDDGPVYSGAAEFTDDDGRLRTLPRGNFHFPASIPLNYPIRIGVGFDTGTGLSACAAAVMILFDSILMSGSGYGVGVELSIWLGYDALTAENRVWAPIKHSERWLHDAGASIHGGLASKNNIKFSSKPFHNVPTHSQPVNIRTLVTQGEAARIAKEYTDFTDTQIRVMRIYGVRAKAIAGTNGTMKHSLGAYSPARREFAFQKNKLSVIAFKGAQ